MKDHAVVPLLLPGMVFLLVPADEPGVVGDEVDGVTDIVVQMADNVDDHDECFQTAIDEEIFDRPHSSQLNVLQM